MADFDVTVNPRNGSLSIMERIYDERTGEQYYQLSEETQKTLNIRPERTRKTHPLDFRPRVWIDEFHYVKYCHEVLIGIQTS